MEIDPIDIADAVAVLRALANPSRLRIALRLLDGETSVGELESALDLRQPNLSQQLGELRDAGLVVARRESRSVFYSLAGDTRSRLVGALLHGFGGAGPLQAEDRPAPKRPAAQAAVFAVVLAAA